MLQLLRVQWLQVRVSVSFFLVVAVVVFVDETALVGEEGEKKEYSRE